MPKIHQSDSYFPIKDCKKNRCKLFGYHNRMYDKHKRISYLCKMFKTKNNPPLYCHGGGGFGFCSYKSKIEGGGPLENATPV